MTLTLYLRLALALALLLAGVALGWYLGAQAPKRALAALQAQDWQSKAQASAAALAEVQGQLATARQVAANNEFIMGGLRSENAQIAADRDANLALARQLLNSQARPAASGGAVPAPADRQQPVGAGDTAAPTRAESMVVDAADECEQTANQLNALIAQLKPQL